MRIAELGGFCRHCSASMRLTLPPLLPPCAACRCCTTTLQVFTSGRLDVYILVPMLWALYNTIPPLLFFVYFFTKGRVLQGMCSVMQVLGVILAAGEGTGFKLCGLGRGLGCWQECCGGGIGGG